MLKILFLFFTFIFICWTTKGKENVKAKAYRSTTYKKYKNKNETKHYKQYTQFKHYTKLHIKHRNLYNTCLKEGQQHRESISWGTEFHEKMLFTKKKIYYTS